MKLTKNSKLLISKPKRRDDIENLATRMREQLDIGEDVYYVDVLSILEFRLKDLFDDDITYSIPDEWTRAEEAYYDSDKNVIFIRAEVYDRAVLGDGRARFTIMHEIAHYILFKIWGNPELMDISEIVRYSNATLHSMDTEWQANTFAGAFLCRNELVRFSEIEEIAGQCGVSLCAAETAFCVSRKIKYKSMSQWIPSSDEDYSYFFSMLQ